MERGAIVISCLVPRNQAGHSQVSESPNDGPFPESTSPKSGLRINTPDLPDLFVVLEYKTGTRELPLAFNSKPLCAVPEALG